MRSSEARAIIEQISNDIWNSQTQKEDPSPVFLILEEAETVLKNIRGQASEAVYRLIHVGRNVRVRCILLSVDLSLIDASVIRQSNIRFHGQLGIEENSKRKFKSYYGQTWEQIAENLSVGQFIRLHKKKLEIIKVPLFESKTRPKLLLMEPSKSQYELRYQEYLKRQAKIDRFGRIAMTRGVPLILGSYFALAQVCNFLFPL